MQQEKKKAIERRYAEAFIAGRVECRSIEDSENPDFWVRRDNASDIGLEVTEYHPTADEVEGIQRREIESRWRESLEPKLDSLRKTRPELRNVHVRLQFNHPRLPKKNEHEALSAELADLLSAAVVSWPAGGREVNLAFASRIEANQCNRFNTGWTFLPKEDWLHSSRHLSSISIWQWAGIDWPPWNCPQVEVAWVTPRPDEFNQILAAKASKARKYNLGDNPLWLLIVVDLPGDTKSQLALLGEEGVKELFATINRCGFDFDNSPFKEVWLLSALFAWDLRLYSMSTDSAPSPPRTP
jgi:hypothetical protein